MSLITVKQQPLYTFRGVSYPSRYLAMLALKAELNALGEDIVAAHWQGVPLSAWRLDKQRWLHSLLGELLTYERGEDNGG